jgi:uncharacterized membrane protein YoaK (UPF0700 family)
MKSSGLEVDGFSVPAQRLLLGYSAVLAFTAGFVNAVALLVLAFPVGSITAVSTQLGMKTAEPLLYEGGILAAILLGFLAGSVTAGAILAPTEYLNGRRHAVVLVFEALLLVAVVGVDAMAVKGTINVFGIEQTALQALLTALALGLQNGLTSSFRGMAIRTTHFTGTVTDLGLMLGRSRRNGIESWKATILTVTLVLFVAGGGCGLLAVDRFGASALAAPAAVCVSVAMVSAYSSHGRRGSPCDFGSRVTLGLRTVRDGRRISAAVRATSPRAHQHRRDD